MSGEPDKIDRRTFLDAALVGGLAVWGAAMAIPTVAYLLPARSGTGKPASVSAGKAKDFPVGSAKMLQAEGKPVLVIRVSEDLFRAFSPVCTHLGCLVKWDDAAQNIKCPCHAAVFDVEGKNVSGPPPRPLQPYSVSMAGDEVVVTL